MIVRNNSFSFGHAGDSVEFQGFSNEKLGFFAVPIGGLFTASPGRALNELKLFKQPPSIVIPIHWLFRRTNRFCKKFQKLFPESRCIMPKDKTLVNWRLNTSE
ncbi:MAG: hypothetical protein ACXAC7_04925 [Candidatus Hodarchaeales archaeon]